MTDSQKRFLKDFVGVAPTGDVSSLTDEGMGFPRVPPLVLYDGHGAKLPFWSSTDSTRAGGTIATAAIVRNANGSGHFGKDSADVGLLLFARKNNHLTSEVQGEVDGLIINATQGRKGDAAAIMAHVTKVRGGEPEDDGAGTPLEIRSEIVDYEGDLVQAIQIIPGFTEAGGNTTSNGQGYGQSIESRAGTWFSAYHANATVSADGAEETFLDNDFQYVTTASSQRLNGDEHIFYAVEWDTGTICMGKPTNRRRLIYDAPTGLFIIQNEDEDPLLQMDSDGVLYLTGTQIGGSRQKLFEEVYYRQLFRPALGVNAQVYVEFDSPACTGTRIGDLVSVYITDTDGTRGKDVNLTGIVFENDVVHVKVENATDAPLLLDTVGLQIVIKVERFSA